jgi:hypothetical protein
MTSRSTTNNRKPKTVTVRGWVARVRARNLTFPLQIYETKAQASTYYGWLPSDLCRATVTVEVST